MADENAQFATLTGPQKDLVRAGVGYTRATKKDHEVKSVNGKYTVISAYRTERNRTSQQAEVIWSLSEHREERGGYSTCIAAGVFRDGEALHG